MAFLGSSNTPAKFGELRDGIKVEGSDITDGSGNVIYNQSNSHIPSNILETPLQINTFSDGGSGFSFNDTSGNTLLNLNNGGGVNIPTGNLNLSDGIRNFYGSNKDFGFFYDNSLDELVLEDSNGVELIRQAKNGATRFLQGIDAGPISAPENSFTQLINSAVTSGLSSGSQVGYSFAVDNNTALSISGEADGSGGTQNVSISIAQDIEGPSTTIFDSVQDHIPTSALQFTDVTITGNNGLAGGTASLGGNITVGLSGTLSLDSDLEAINGETIYSESNTEIVESILPSISNSTLTNSSITINGSPVALGGSTTINVDLDDDKQRLFGSNTNIGLRFDSTNDSFRIRDNINGVDIVDVDRTSGDVGISGTLTEGAAL